MLVYEPNNMETVFVVFQDILEYLIVCKIIRKQENKKIKIRWAYVLSKIGIL